MKQLHPALPTQEQLRQWEEDWYNEREHADVLLIQAFQAGADAELEACCAWMEKGPYGFSIAASAPDLTSSLRTARRPNPPSLKQQALEALEDGDLGPGASLTPVEVCIIRRALEALPD